MFTSCFARFLRFSRVALPAFLFACSTSLHAQHLNLTGDGMSAVWEHIYSAEGCDPNADPDGDGVPNRLEAIAGTDPFDSNSVPKISWFNMTTNGMQVTISGQLGKKYELQSSQFIGGATTNWITEVGMVARTNPLVSLTAPADLGAKFFRVVISDVDSDGDGLNDWEEYQLGLDPFNAYSNGHLDANGKPMTDYEYAAGLYNLAFKSKSGVSGADGQSGRLALYPSVSSTGTGLTGNYYTSSSRTYTNLANFNPTNLFLTTNDVMINFVWGPGTSPNLSNGLYSVRWTGQVEPEFSESYTFEMRSDDGAKVWVNDQLLIDKWQAQGPTSWTGTIPMQAGVLYDIRVDYFNTGGGAQAQLYWYSQSQPRQIIPSSQLYPSSAGAAPGGVTSPLTAVAFLGQPFSYTITGANSPLGFGATNLPAGLVLNTTNGLISGAPGVAGDFQIGISVTNAVGSSFAVLDLQVMDTGTSVTREVWLNVAGTTVASIPVNTPATITNSLGTLEGITNFGDNYGERIRGYITAPVTGNYYFWIAASDTAELWISNDSEPVNKVRRAYVGPKGTAPRQWNLQPNQQSAWLSLVAGNQYYIEILHKAGKGKNDNWSVGWLQDPNGTNTVPAGVVPGYVLSPYVPVPLSQQPGTLYTANMLALPGVASTAVGSATLRVSADGTLAILNFTVNNLSSTISSEHIDSDPYLSNPSQLIYDISAASPGPDGSYEWDFAPVGTLSAADLLEIISEGKASINIHTEDFPDGEISGHFTLAEGAPTFTPPPAPPAWLDDHKNPNGAARFLTQATFGPTPADIKSVTSSGYASWISKQFKLKPTSHLVNVQAIINADPNEQYDENATFNTWWQRAVTAPDQLRQRVAFALSEILVVSQNGVLGNNPVALSGYYDVLVTNAFGNFRTLLENVTLSPAMGDYLDMRGNDKGSLALGTHPDENYAREVMQLFSIGLNRMWPDGSLVLDSQGNLIPTYDQNDIMGFARVYTGWNYYQTNQANNRLPSNWYPSSSYLRPMVLVPAHHELGTKQLLDNVVLPAAQGAQAYSTNVSFDTYCSQDLEKALDSIFYNENVGPFICRQLIQRLVTSQPSRGYLYRVVQKFDDNGSGVRGDMQAVISAILLDYEARSTNLVTAPAFGKQREPLVRATAVARAFAAPPVLSGSYKQNGSEIITVTTSKPHRLSSSDDVFLSFPGSGSKAVPASQIYNNVSVTNVKSFNIVAPGVSPGKCSQGGNTIQITSSNHGLSVGEQIYLVFTTGGLANGVYTVATVSSSSVFSVNTTSSGNVLGTCLFPSWNGSYTQTKTTVSVWTPGPHGLKAGNPVYLAFGSGGSISNGVYTVSAVSGANWFTVGIASSGYGGSVTVLPLVAPPLKRSGSVKVQYSTWAMNQTDTGYNSALYQTPLNSPTVFNFFYPSYQFPGVLASAGLTTPEFQLTSDTSVVLQMNFLSGGIFYNSSNTNGLSSFSGGNGAIMLDLGPWMTPQYASNAGIPSLVDTFNSLLCAGQLSTAAKAIIVGYVANTSNFPYTTPTNTQMRDRVRAVAQLIINSPEFTIQR